MSDASTAFTAGAVAALGSSVVKVPLAVCIRSVQAGIYRNVFHAAQSIVSAAGVRGLFTVRGRGGRLGGWGRSKGLGQPWGLQLQQLTASSLPTSTCAAAWCGTALRKHRTAAPRLCACPSRLLLTPLALPPVALPLPLLQGFLPTVLEDVPDMAVKFAVYEMMRGVHARLRNGRPANVAEDLVMGGFAGAAAAAATTPLDVLKTVMMCSASSRPTIVTAAAGIMKEGKGLKPFFRGVGPRALSNGLNSAIFFCFFEAIRQVGGGGVVWGVAGLR